MKIRYHSIFRGLAGLIVMTLAGLALPAVPYAATEAKQKSPRGESRELKEFPEEAEVPEKVDSKEDAETLAEDDSAPLSDEDAYVLEPGDRIKMRIYPEDEYIKGGEMQLSSDGNLTLPLAGKIHVGGMKVLSAQKKIAKIIDADYIVDPEVVIEVIQFKVHNFVILGEVRKPGTFAFPEGSSKLTLLQAISIAGGFSELANTKRIKVVRSHGGQNQVIRANAEAIISGDDPDIELKPDDVVNVSESMF